MPIRLTKKQAEKLNKDIIEPKQKYRNKKTEIDGILFDSKKEAEYYCELKLRKQSGDILEFIRQRKYILQEGFIKNGKRYKEISYYADFVIIHKDGRVEVIDTKGYQTQIFKLKQKLFEKRYPDMTITVI